VLFSEEEEEVHWIISSKSRIGTEEKGKLTLIVFVLIRRE